MGIPKGYQIYKKVQDIDRMYGVEHVMCEPHHQHQNFVGNRIGTLKDMTNIVDPASIDYTIYRRP